ncbi:MAG: Zn-dependent alcohol dehydrogenase [Acidimicrobiales bacterium]
MRAALLESPNQDLTIVDDVELDDPHAGEVLVRVHHCGVCHSDLHVIDGSLPAPMPIILGHEAGGVVEAIGPGVTEVAPGDKVILTLRPPCGRCYWCVRGEWSQCAPAAALTAGQFADGATRLTRGGEVVHRALVVLAAFAERTVVPVSAAVKVPEDTPLDIAAVIGCAVQTGVGAVVNTARVQAGDTVAVIGLGGIGISVVQGARIAGASRIIGVDSVESRRQQAERFGVTDAVDPDLGDVGGRIRSLTDGIGVDHAFEAVGRAALIETALDATRTGGTTVIVGVPGLADMLNLHALTFWSTTKTLKGTFLGDANPHRDFARLLSLWRAGRLDLEGMVTAHRPLAEINEALADMKAGVGLRTVLEIG